jgi:glyceraldehyde-3-phosphate dehydrogenase (NAD(P))
MKVLVNGIGNIGTTLLNILVDFKTDLGINEIYALKNTNINTWNLSDLQHLEKKGIKIYTKQENERFLPKNALPDDINYIFDCTANTFGLKNKPWYQSLKNLKACSAQGSEKGFGIPYMAGINDNEISGQKYAHIVSCNTHALASLLSTFSGQSLEKLIEADFVIVRRSEDLGNHQRLVSANVVSRHRHKLFGTHHAEDAVDLFSTKNIKPRISSSDITTPSQLMHTVRFAIRLSEKVGNEYIYNQIKTSAFISRTSKFDSNVIFEIGRRYGYNGRLYSHAIINHTNIMLSQDDKTIYGWAFIPQEGNTIISTLSAFLIQTKNNEHNKIISKICDKMIIRDL